MLVRFVGIVTELHEPLPHEPALPDVRYIFQRRCRDGQLASCDSRGVLSLVKQEYAVPWPNESPAALARLENPNAAV